MSYLDFLHKGPNYLSPAVPIGVREVRPDGCRKLTNPLGRNSQVLRLIDVARISLYLDVKLCDAALSSSHPRCELILFNQALGEAVDQPLKRVLLFDAPDF